MDAGCPGLVAATPQDLGDPGGGQGRSPGPEPEAVQAGQLVACARQEYRVTGFHDGFQLMHPYQTVSVLGPPPKGQRPDAVKMIRN
jgi:hypothetical protein